MESVATILARRFKPDGYRHNIDKCPDLRERLEKQKIYAFQVFNVSLEPNKRMVCLFDWDWRIISQELVDFTQESKRVVDFLADVVISDAVIWYEEPRFWPTFDQFLAFQIGRRQAEFKLSFDQLSELWSAIQKKLAEAT